MVANPILIVVVCTTIACQNQRRQDEPLFSTSADKLGIVAVAFSADGKWIFSAGSEGLKQWDASSFKLVHEPRIEIGEPGYDTTYSIRSIASSPIRPELYLAGGVNGIVIWNYDTKRVAARIPSSAESVAALAVNKQGTLLAIAENDLKHHSDAQGEYKIRVLNLQNLSTSQLLNGHTQPINSLDFSNSGEFLFSRAVAGGIVWAVDSGVIKTKVGSFDMEWSPGEPEGRNSLFSPDDKFAIFFDKVYSAESWTEVSPFPTGSRASAFSPNGRHVLLGGKGKAVLFDFESRQVITEFVQFPKTLEPVRCVAISPDGTLAVTGGWGTHIKWPDYSKPTDVKRNLCFWRMPKEESPKK